MRPLCCYVDYYCWTLWNGPHYDKLLDKSLPKHTFSSTARSVVIRNKEVINALFHYSTLLNKNTNYPSWDPEI